MRQRPSRQRTGRAVGQRVTVGQSVTRSRHEPSGQRDVPEAQAGGSAHVALVAAHWPSGQRTGASPGQRVVRGHCDRLAAQEPSAHCACVAEQPDDCAAQDEAEMAHWRSGHSTGALAGHEGREAQKKKFSTHEPSAQRTRPAAQAEVVGQVARVG
jgi:hypothetical protein